MGRGRDRKIVDSSHFLPQLLHVIVPNTLQNENTRQMMREKSHPKINDVILKAVEINKELGASTRNPLFLTEDKPIKAKGWYLPSPLICFNGI